VCACAREREREREIKSHSDQDNTEHINTRGSASSSHENYHLQTKSSLLEKSSQSEARSSESCESGSNARIIVRDSTKSKLKQKVMTTGERCTELEKKLTEQILNLKELENKVLALQVWKEVHISERMCYHVSDSKRAQHIGPRGSSSYTAQEEGSCESGPNPGIQKVNDSNLNCDSMNSISGSESCESGLHARIIDHDSSNSKQKQKIVTIGKNLEERGYHITLELEKKVSEQNVKIKELESRLVALEELKKVHELQRKRVEDTIDKICYHVNETKKVLPPIVN
jgi:uncharacterized coiled-coil protein SlyX